MTPGHALTAVAEAAHAFLAPSSAHRWVFCPGSAQLEAMYPELETTPEAAAGTAAHWVFEVMLLHDRVPAVNEMAPNGVPIDLTMIEAAQLVYNDVVSTLGPDWKQRVIVEKRVMIPDVHASANWGTPDIRGWTQLGDGRWVLHIWDFKYGYRLVEAFENWQCIDYASGCLSEAGVNGLTDQNIIVSITVIQPRAPHPEGPVRRWKIIAAHLRAHVNRLRMSAENATSADPKCYPHPDACQDCRGRKACTALQRASFDGVELGHALQPLDLTPEALGLELKTLERAAALMKARITGLEEQARSLIKGGHRVAWYGLQPTQGNKEWKVPIEQILTLGRMAGKDFKKPDDVITPTQAAQRAPELKTVIDSMSSRPVGAVKLVRDDGNTARRIFSAPV